MRGYQPPPRFVWGAAIAAALALALWAASRATVGAIRASERAAVLAEGDTLLRLALAQGDTLRRLADSLRIEAAHRDTILVHTIERVKGEAAKPIPPGTDTTALIAAVRSCRAALDTLVADCAQFREVATTALAKADTIQRRDSAAIAGLSLQLAVIRRADSLRATRETRAGKWRALERGVCAGSIAANVFTLTR